jgi:threonine dehydrogenase-like Zn-dependent dehydrogenase
MIGIRFFTGRAHAAALLPAVMSLIEQGRLHPEDATTRVVDWEDAQAAFAARHQARRPPALKRPAKRLAAVCERYG